MSLKATWFRDKLNKKAKRGFQGYPVATITYYGPDDRRASKVSVGIIREEGGEIKWPWTLMPLGLAGDWIKEIRKGLKEFEHKQRTSFL
jgi:hypothetical protein